MFKVHRELLTTTSERKSGFNSGEDEFELEDGSNAKALKYSQRINKGKDFRSTDEGGFKFLIWIIFPSFDFAILCQPGLIVNGVMVELC